MERNEKRKSNINMERKKKIVKKKNVMHIIMEKGKGL